jgi:glutathione S-transferase
MSAPSRSHLTVYGVGTSRTLRVHWLAHELGLDYDIEPVQARNGDTQKDTYRQMSPKSKVPVLRHGDFVVTESPAILTYLAEQFAPEQGFFVPNNAIERARLNEWCFFIMTELDAHPLYIIRRHQALKDIYGEAPQAVASAREYFARMASAMEPRVAAVKQYLLGDEISVADILLTTVLTWAHNYELELSDACHAYRQRLTARPAYQAALAINQPPKA